MTKFQKTVIALLAALVIVGGVGVAVIVKQLSDAERQRDYLQCMAVRGVTPDDPGSLDDALAAAEACSK